MKVLDLFCGAGGCSAGYSAAGFAVVGMDIKPQPHYPFDFYNWDVMKWIDGVYGHHYPSFHWSEFDLIHASPPCQCYSLAASAHRNKGKVYPDLIEPVRIFLEKTGKPYVIENIPQAPLNRYKSITLCGTMFNLGVFRHRVFESNIKLIAPKHGLHAGKIGDGKYFSIAGGAGRWKSWGTIKKDINKGTAEEWRKAMDINWMTRKELTQAIPPAYMEFIGKQLIAKI